MIGLVIAVSSFAALFRDLGLSAAAVQKGSLTHQQMTNLFWLNVMMGAVLMVLMAASSPLVAVFFDNSDLRNLTLLLSVKFLLNSLGTQHGALMQRNLEFGKRAFATIGGSVVTLIISVLLAFKGLSYWSLAWGSLAGSLTTTVLLFFLSSFRPGRWTGLESLKPLLRFGMNVTAFDFINYFHRNTDTFLIGKFYGEESLGLYNRAYQLLMLPIVRIRGPINSVAFPVLSRLQDKPDAFRRFFRKIIYLLAVTSMPLVALLFLVSHDLIYVTLGKAWLEAAPIFSFLSLTAFIQPVASLRGMVLMATGQSKRYLNWGIVNAVLVTIGFLIGISWGAVGVAISYAVVNYLLLFPSVIYVFEKTPLELSDFFKPIAFPVTSSLITIIICHVSFGFFDGMNEWEVWLRLLISICSFCGVWLLIMLCFTKSRQEFLSIPLLLRSLKPKKS